MSVILQSGDRIHLAVPCPAGLTAGERELAVRQAKETIDTISKAYALMGVTVAVTSWSSTLPGPNVVAVFREPRKACR